MMCELKKKINNPVTIVGNNTELLLIGIKPESKKL